MPVNFTAKPNIVFIETDSMDGRAYGAMGFGPLKNGTPAFDAMAASGVMFENMYSNNPICVCSRASMICGQYTHNCHAWNNYKGIPESQKNIFTEFGASGYNMGIFGKTDYVSGQHSQRARVTAWLRTADLHLPEYRESAPEVLDNYEKRVRTGDWKKMDDCVRWLDQNSKSEKPFFLYLGLNLPHPEFRTSKYYLEKIDRDKIEIPPADTYKHPVMEYQKISKNWTHGFDPENVKKTRAVYYSMIAEADAITGELIEAVKQRGLDKNTFFIYTSDHGEMAMEHGQFYKSNMYEPAVRVPLIIAGPNVKAGLRIKRAVSLVDIFPTLVSMADIKTGVKLDGHSLTPEMQGYGSELPDCVFSEYHECSVNASTSMIREGDWKLIAFARGFPPLLFNLKEDPWETRDLAALLPEKTAAMKKKLYQISDLDMVGKLVEENGQDCFRVWRDEQKTAGTYEKTMARIYAGWDHIGGDDKIPVWSDANEKKIIGWLEKMPGEF
ncbi:MAG: sulfatase-like hydrolase/transferase [Treponema sp.]|nr:sulfatase-like hydrolase/transferase [Treponema sp.]